MPRTLIYSTTLGILMSTSHIAQAGSNSVEKIYNPYVQQLENELEYEFILQDDERAEFANQQTYRISYGQAINDRWLLEAGVIGVNNPSDNFDIAAYEFEAKYQLSEQGEFNNDWGVLFEVERETDNDIWEIGTTLIVLHNWKKWTGTANITVTYETGPTIDDEFETEFAGQLKYRYKSSLEPGIEFFKSESTNAFGPSLTGQVRLGGGKNFFWGTAALVSFDSSKPDNIFRFNIEYEF